MRTLVIPALLLALVFLVTRLPAPSVPAGSPVEASTAAAPPAAAPNSHYPSNRPPLAPSPLVKLPIGAVEPRGWLMAQLQLMRNGLTGRLGEVSRFLGDDSGWITLKGKGWEELPYWLKGYGDLGYLLKDAVLRKETERWLAHAFRSQDRDGYFRPGRQPRGPRPLAEHGHAGGPAELSTRPPGTAASCRSMSRFFQYEFHLPVEDLLPGSWQKLRGGENLESVYWLYNRTGESFLLDLAKRIYARTADWGSPILTRRARPELGRKLLLPRRQHRHGLPLPRDLLPADARRVPARSVERNYRQVMDRYGRQPGGMFGADENIRPGKEDPRQGAETCTMVEFMASFESLLKITGDPVWADRAEEVAFNSLPASMTPDLKGLHYLTAANLISCDSSGEHDFQNSGTLVSFDPWSYRCCQHNVAFGWPYLAEHLWMATADNGLGRRALRPLGRHGQGRRGSGGRDRRRDGLSLRGRGPAGRRLRTAGRFPALPAAARLGQEGPDHRQRGGRRGRLPRRPLRRPPANLAPRRPGPAGIRPGDRDRHLAVGPAARSRSGAARSGTP